jgi:BirA family biotin operon repressor/biotin-[acetyl-CoA-carboxylase] ligase
LESRFQARVVNANLSGTRFAGRVIHFPVVESTNTLAIEAAQSGVRTGVWVADEQTAGRGRGGHQWHSAPGDGLYMSVLVTPELRMDRALMVPLAMGLAAQTGLTEAAGVTIDLRWPNDLMLEGKKVGGILVESANDSGAGGAMLRYAVIGIGINVNHAEFPEELAGVATSLRMVTGQELRRENLVVSILRGLEREIVGLDAGGVGLLDRFTKASSWVKGMRVRVGEDGGYTGVTCGLDERGFLLVQTDGGEVKTVLSGGVRPE